MGFRVAIFSMALLLSGLGASSEARAVDLGHDYLLGTWILDETDCSSADAEFVTFRDTGSVEAVRGGRLELTGFWEVNDEVIEVQAVASPAFFQDADDDLARLAAFEGQFFAFGIRVITLNLEPDGFDAVGMIGEEVKTSVWSRCQSS